MIEQTKTKVRGFVAGIIVLAILCGVLVIGYIGNTALMMSYSTQLENNYQRSIYELMNDVNSIETNLSKALVSTGIETQKVLYDKIYTDSTQTSEDLSRLPINHERVYQTTSFINQVGGFSYYLKKKLSEGTNISETDYNSVNDLHTTCLYIQSILNDFMSQYSGKYSILASGNDIDNTGNSFNSMFSSMQAEGVNYPTLIYDGSFSESQTNKQIKGLGGAEVTQQEALEKVKKIYDKTDYKEMIYLSETTGIFTTYNILVVNNENRQIYIQVTKKGGFVLTISSYAASDVDSLELSACETKAEEFAKSLA